VAFFSFYVDLVVITAGLGINKQKKEGNKGIAKKLCTKGGCLYLQMNM